MSDQRQPDFDEEEANGFIGKHVPVGVTHRNLAGDVTSVEQFRGEIVRASREGGIMMRLESSWEERWLPPDFSRLAAATPGDWLKATGEVVANPDFVAIWTVYPPNLH